MKQSDVFQFIPMNLQLFADETGAEGSAADSQSADSYEDNSGDDSFGSESDTDGDNSSGGAAAATQQRSKQTPEQNAAFAELRRNKEAAERKAFQLEQERQRDRHITQKYGQEYGVYSEADIAAKYGASHGIQTLAQFEAKLQEQSYREKGIDPNLINQIIENHPSIKAAKEQQGQAIINSELQELAEEYPELKLKTIKDLQNLPNYEEIFTKAKKGYSLVDAYVSVNRSKIRDEAMEQGASRTMRNIGSKAHLDTERSGNQRQGKEVNLTSEQLRVWTAMGYSEAEARKRAAKYVKK